MNDELDVLRSFRPEAIGPTDVLQLQERNAFMDTIARVQTGPARRNMRVRPRRGILLGIAIALITAVGTAGATGLIPDDVQQALGLAAANDTNAAFAPEVDQAVERASTATAGGGTLQLWSAPTNGGGACAYLRALDSGGAPTESGPISCEVSIAGGGSMGDVSGRAGSRSGGMNVTIGGPLGSGRLSAQLEVDGQGADTLFGQAPGGVAKVEIVDGAGSVLAEAVADDGWFVLQLSASVESAAVSFVALSASGAAIDTVPIATPVPPAAATTGTGS
jgi:hypothetical protein